MGKSNQQPAHQAVAVPAKGPGLPNSGVSADSPCTARLKHRVKPFQLDQHTLNSILRTKGIKIIIHLLPGHYFAMKKVNYWEKHPVDPVALHIEEYATLSIGK